MLIIYYVIEERVKLIKEYFHLHNHLIERISKVMMGMFQIEELLVELI